MVRNNYVISKNHFKKDWKEHVVLRLNGEFRKRRRNLKRLRKAIAVAPRPANGPVRPLVQCPSIRYNTKPRYGRGFTLAEIRSAGLNKRFAQTIGVAVDHRRQNKSYEVLQRNVQRLKEYLARLVLVPKSKKKVAKFESPAEQYEKCAQLFGKIMPKPKPRKMGKAMLVSSVPKIDAYLTLRLAKSAGKRALNKNKAKKPRVTFE